MFVMDMPPEETVIKVPANPLNVQDVETPSDAIQPNFWRGVFFWCGLLVKEFQSNNNEMGNTSFDKSRCHTKTWLNLLQGEELLVKKQVQNKVSTIVV